VRYGMYFRRISLLKLIFLLLWVQLGSDYQRTSSFFDSLVPSIAKTAKEINFSTKIIRELRGSGFERDMTPI